jgi:hypothetical protein
MKKYISLFLGLGLLMAGCSKSDDDAGIGPDGPTNQDPDFLVQDFMWKALNLWYFWQADVVDLADDRFDTNEEYTEFLKSGADPADFFLDILLFSEDRFSFLSDDYVELTQNLSGISRSNGLEFSLTYFDDNNNNMLDPSEEIFGFVRYIVNNSDASTKAVARGDLFTGVDGQTLIGMNFEDLLFGENDTMLVGKADPLTPGSST